MRRIRSLFLVGLTASIIGLIPLTGAAAASPPRDRWLPELRGSDNIDGPEVVRGILNGRNGQPHSGRLTLVAWPTQEVLSRLDVGDHVKTVPVGKAFAGRDGRFVLRIDPTVPIAEFIAANGVVNFDLLGDGDGASTVHAFPRRLTSAATGGIARWAATEASSAGVGNEAGRLDVSLTLDRVSAAPDGVQAPVPATNRTCMQTVRATYNGVWDVNGEVYTGPNTTGDFQYVNGASSTLGVGFSVSGNSGSFMASGTSSSSSTFTIDYPTQAQNKKSVMQTTFRYQKFEQRCFIEPFGPWISTGFEVRPTAFQGGNNIYATPSAPTASNCTPYIKGSKVTKHTAQAVTFSNGLSLHNFVGIDLSTSTGFTNEAKIAFTYVNAGKLCGTNAFPPDANRVVAK